MRMNVVPMTANTSVVIFEIGVALSGIAISTAKSTNAHIVAKMTGLLFLGMPFPHGNF